MIQQQRVAFAALLVVACLPAFAGATTDLLRFGDSASEMAHGLHAQASSVVKGLLDQPARIFLPNGGGDWRGGSATFRLRVNGKARNYLSARFSGEDVSGNQATLFCDGKQLGYRQLSDIDILDQGTKYPVAPGRFHYVTHPLPRQLTDGKREIQCCLQSSGPVWRYGGDFATFQKPMTEATRGFYALIVHGDKMVPLDAVEGRAPASPVKQGDGAPVLDKVKERVDRQLAAMWARKAPPNQLEIAFLAKTYETPWSRGYRERRSLDLIAAGIDEMWSKYKSDPRIAYYDKNTPNEGWFGLGLIGQALKRTQGALNADLDVLAPGGDAATSRRKALEQIFADSREWNKQHRRLYTNQSMIKDLYGIWYNNEGLIAIGSQLAEPREKLLPLFYQSLGLEPWAGSFNAQGQPTYAAAEADAKFSVPKNYFQTTKNGLTKELGYVGGYGEVLDWAAEIYEATRPASGQPGDRKVRDQLVTIAQARSYFRYPHWDHEGKRAMRLEAAIGWRDLYYPSDIMYAQRASWDASPLQVAVATADPKLVGYAQQMIADNQFFGSVEHMLEAGSLRATIGLIDVVGEYDALQGMAQQPFKLPMSDGQPDFAFADAENGVVALRRGNEILYASLYWRANYGISGLARVHYVTPTTDRTATVALDREEFEPSGLFYARPNNPHVNGHRFSIRYPGDGDVWTAGERQPVAKLPEGVKYVPGEDNAFAGRADYYQLRYGPYLIAMNSSRDRQFSLALPKRKAAARELVSGAVVPASASAIPVGPGETVVVALE
ncbi:hypothetical protein ACHMW6_15925 [Pseudoduganella sp. UC29_106]|uniref:hypothetical protein n=1 Tax=Pseudoduganella sp. UC29_106 TaxID=3374553 RepID=UPI00375663E5